MQDLKLTAPAHKETSLHIKRRSIFVHRGVPVCALGMSFRKALLEEQDAVQMLTWYGQAQSVTGGMVKRCTGGRKVKVAQTTVALNCIRNHPQGVAQTNRQKRRQPSL